MRHVYIERRLTPLNLHLARADARERMRALREYGDTIEELAGANIFAGDLLFKNFGLTRYGRVVFYDYDEIEYLTDCTFRRIPDAPEGIDELSPEVWYIGRAARRVSRGIRDVPADRCMREAFLRHHAHLDARWWQGVQQAIREGAVPEVLSYPNSFYVHCKARRRLRCL